MSLPLTAWNCDEIKPWVQEALLPRKNTTTMPDALLYPFRATIISGWKLGMEK